MFKIRVGMSFSLGKIALLVLTIALFGWAYVNYAIIAAYHPNSVSSRLGLLFFWLFSAVIIGNAVCFLFVRSDIPAVYEPRKRLHFRVFIGTIAAFLVAFFVRLPLFASY
jgi:hypothetical protein